MLKQRIITALILVACLASALFLLPESTVWIVFATIAAVAGWEWGGLMGLASKGRVGYGSAIFLVCWVTAIVVPSFGLIVLAISAAFWLCLVPVWLRMQWRLGGNVQGHVLGFIVLVATAVALGILYRKGAWFLLATMALVWVADVAAYFAGRRFGKHKLAPTISPGKTWEGVAGACVGVMVYGLALLQSPWGTAWSLPLVAAVVLLVVLTGVSVIGDLFESMLKRQAGIKDSSHLLPGHGGVLDRIDSLTSTLPVAALLVTVLS